MIKLLIKQEFYEWSRFPKHRADICILYYHNIIRNIWIFLENFFFFNIIIESTNYFHKYSNLLKAYEKKLWHTVLKYKNEDNIWLIDV